MILNLLTICALIGPLNTAWWAEDAAVSSTPVDLMTSLAAYWEMEETGTRTDSRNDYDLLEFNGSSTRSEDQMLGSYAVLFSGDGEALGTNNAIFSASNQWPFTVNFWYKRNGADTANQFVMGMWDSNNWDSSAWYVSVDAAPRAIFNIVNGTGGTVSWSNNATLGANYTMVTVTWDDAAFTSTVYVNAAPATSEMEDMYNGGGGKFTMGSDSAYQFAYGSFLIDSVAYWTNRILSAIEVTNLYNGGSGRTYPF